MHCALWEQLWCNFNEVNRYHTQGLNLRACVPGARGSYTYLYSHPLHRKVSTRFHPDSHVIVHFKKLQLKSMCCNGFINSATRVLCAFPFYERGGAWIAL